MSESGFWRFSTLAVAFLIAGVMIVFQLLRIQISPQNQEFISQGQEHSGYWRTVYPARGQIYDRWGNLLAGNREVYQVGVDLSQVTDPEGIALTLSAVLGEDYQKVLEIVSQEATEEAVFAVVTDFVPEEKVIQLQQIREAYAAQGAVSPNARSLAGLIFVSHLARSYPEDDLAANILGFVSRNGEGYFGVEEKYNDLLAGQPETIWMPLNPNDVESLPEIQDGTKLVLTIDREVQAMLEEVLDDAVEEYGAEAGTIIVMDPRTGEILGMAVTPRINLNEYWNYEEIISGVTPFNRGISKAYEPGSVFKVLTMAAALDSGDVKPGTVFNDSGAIEIGGAVIHNWNRAAWGDQDMLGCMQHSLNVCLAWVASRLGPNDFYWYMTQFGIGHTTGVDMAGEVSGRLKLPGDADWYAADLGTNSFGQGVSVTPMQLIMAVSALANGGQMMTPHIVRSTVTQNNQFTPSPRVFNSPISAETARTISLMLASSLENEASSALVPGYRLAGKTGTAEIPTAVGYTSSVTHTSFVGWGPVDDPQFIVYIWLEKPSSSIWGSEVAAPVFHDVVERLVLLLNIPPDNVRDAMSGSPQHP
jgi:cell division protein FtsI/penicillin-binding protein 2